MVRESVTEKKDLQWVGVDVAKQTFQAALARPGQRFGLTKLGELPTESFPRTREGVERFVDWLALLLPAKREALNTRVVMETTGKYSIELAALMDAVGCGLRPAIVHARQTNAFIKSMNVRGKTDALEARALAFYGIERSPVAYEPLTEEQSTLRELVRHRRTLVEQKCNADNRGGEGSTSEYVRKARVREHNFLNKEIARVDKEIRECIAKSEALKKDYALLTTIHGVAFVTASVILAELGDLRRFERARQLSAFVGLSPREVQSGTSVFKKAHMCKQGNASVRQALYLAALTAVRDGGYLQENYRRACAQGKPKMVALGMIMRKLIVLMRTMLINNQEYDRNRRPNVQQNDIQEARA